MHRLSDCNEKHALYADGTKYHGPEQSEQRIPARNALYQQLLGELRYLADWTRPDISFAVNGLICTNDDLKQRQWHILKQLLRYVQSIINLGFIYDPTQRYGTFHIPSYADADFPGYTKNRKSISGERHT